MKVVQKSGMDARQFSVHEAQRKRLGDRTIDVDVRTTRRVGMRQVSNSPKATKQRSRTTSEPRRRAARKRPTRKRAAKERGTAPRASGCSVCPSHAVGSRRTSTGRARTPGPASPRQAGTTGSQFRVNKPPVQHLGMRTFLSGSTLGDRVPTPDEIRFADVLNEKFIACEETFGTRFRAYCGGRLGYVIRRYEPACTTGTGGGDVLGRSKPISMGPISLDRFFERHFGMTFTQFLTMPTPDVIDAVQKHQNSLLLVDKKTKKIPSGAQKAAVSTPKKSAPKKASGGAPTKKKSRWDSQTPEELAAIGHGLEKAISSPLFGGKRQEVKPKPEPVAPQEQETRTSQRRPYYHIAVLGTKITDDRDSYFMFYQYANGEMIQREMRVLKDGSVSLHPPTHRRMSEEQYDIALSLVEYEGWGVFTLEDGNLLDQAPQTLLEVILRYWPIPVNPEKRISVEQETRPRSGSADDSGILVMRHSPHYDTYENQHFLFMQYVGGEMIQRNLHVHEGRAQVDAPSRERMTRDEYASAVYDRRDRDWGIIGRMSGRLLDLAPSDLLAFIGRTVTIFIDPESAIEVEGVSTIVPTKTTTMQVTPTPRQAPQAVREHKSPDAAPGSDTTEKPDAPAPGESTVAAEDLDAMGKELESIAALLNQALKK